MGDRRERNHQWWSRFDEKTMHIIIEDGEGIEHALPAKYEVCETCHGKGTHVNPSIDSHGISAEEFADDPDFAEAYWRGDYDQLCNECNGRRVVPAVDEPRCSEEDLQLASQRAKDHYEIEASYEAERRFGA